MYPVAALMLRQAAVKQGATVVHEERHVSDLWQRKPPIIAEGATFDPVQDAVDERGSYQGGSVSRLAFLCGRVEATVKENEAGDNVVQELADYIDTKGEKVISTTGEIHYEYGRKLWKLTAPASAGSGRVFWVRSRNQSTVEPCASIVKMSMPRLLPFHWIISR